MENTLINAEWALITGASSGIGRAFAENLAMLGYNLILVARRENKLIELKNSILKKTSILIEIINVDLSDENSCLIIEELIKNKDIGFLVNNAGFGLSGEMLENNISQYLKMIKLNCLTPLYLTKIIADKMKTKQKGKIIFIGSVLSFIPTPYNAVYSATKAFDESLACGLWYELKRYKIDVLCVNPGTTKTEFHSNAGLIQNKRFRYPEQVVVTALKNIGKKPTVVDGLINKFVLFLTMFISRKQLIKYSGNIFNKIKIEHEK